MALWVNMEIDHILIFTQYGAPEAEVLKNFGFIEGQGNTHIGQGTKNRRFFFGNMFLELIWLENGKEAQSPVTQPTLLYERFTQKSCPFGICFRPSNTHTLNFETWNYKPAYLPEHLTIQLAKNNSLQEPMWFYASFLSASTRQAPIIERVEITLPTPNQIQPATDLIIKQGNEYLLTIKIKDSSAIYDCRPTLPLILV